MTAEGYRNTTAGRPTESLGGRRVALCVAGIVALLLISLALPRAIAGFLALPGEPWLRKVQSGEMIGETGVRILRKTRATAAAWSDDPRLRTDRALADLVEAADPETPDSRRESLIAQADAALVEGLSAGPGNPFAWSRLARTRWLAGAEPEALAEYLRLSLLTGPMIPRLAVARAELGFALWPILAPAGQAAVEQQARLAWNDRKTRGLLVDTMVASGQVPRLRVALLPDIQRLIALETEIRKRGAER